MLTPDVDARSAVPAGSARTPFPRLGQGVTALDEAGRVRLTVSCRDADPIPKVERAGEVVTDGDVAVQVMHNGVKIVEGCYYGGWMTEIIRSLRGHHEPQEEAVFAVVLEQLGSARPPVMLELGSFWAYYSLWFLQRWPQGRAVMVEPDPAYLEVGRRNFALNGRDGTFQQAAVGSSDADMAFRCESDSRVRTIPGRSLSGILGEHGLDVVDLLLIDVQGAETDFLVAAEGLLAERVRFVIVSTHHHVISGDPRTHQRCLEVIRRAGGTVVAEHTVAESFSGDGLIVASFDQRDSGLKVELSRARTGSSLYGDPLDELAAFSAAALAADDAARVTTGRLHDLERQQEAMAPRISEMQADLVAIRSTLTWRLHGLLARQPGVRRVVGRLRAALSRRH